MMTSTSPYFLPKEAISHYESEGYYFPVGSIPSEMISNAVQQIESLMANPPGLDHPWNLKSHLLFKWVYDLTVHPVVLDAVESAIGPDIIMQAADIFAKPAHTTKHVNWHQDANYWGLEPLELCTAWIALTDVFPENGCMRFLAGTHKQNKIEHVETYAKDSALTRGQELTLDIDEDKTVDVILKAGQVSLHHCLLAHASGPNQTASPRIGIAVRYLATNIRQTEGPPMSGILVRGADTYKHFKHDSPPLNNFDQAAIEAHARSMAPHAAANYATA